MAKVSLLDGSFGSQISTHVGKSPDGDPLWTARFIMTDIKAIHDTHLDYLRAGADIIETPTYQGSIDGFKKHFGLSDTDCRDPFYIATDIAKRSIFTYKEEIGERKVANAKPLIAGSCGPYGAALHDGSEYTGSYCKNLTKEFLIDWHRPRVDALLKGNVDLLAFETIPCEQEAEAIVQLLKEYPNAKAWLSFSCGKDGASLANGSNFREVATRCYREALPGQIVAVGVNCLSPCIVTSLLKDINSEDSDEKIPLIAYPNSGEIYSEEAGWKMDDSQKPMGLENYVYEWLDLGVRYIGGCCRIGANEIAKIRSQIELWQSQERETSL